MIAYIQPYIVENSTNRDCMMANRRRPGLSKKLPLVGQVLLDDLRFASEETKESIKAAVVALLEKRVKPYKNSDPCRDMNTTLQKSMNTDYLGDHDAAFVDMVLQDLDKIIDVRDRDECEILITKPDFQEVTDESKIPGYRGFTVVHQGTDVSSYTSEVVDVRVSIIVAFWNSKIVKLDNVDDVNNRIKKCLFPLKPKNINKR